ncbi:hypothetical protein GQ53DRAFT_50293 [Thozetella sp. PMI_491]|nr:hypothetical protein GQ53DRAFT_50293 [Thozetella sp. PMI_491]
MQIQNIVALCALIWWQVEACTTDEDCSLNGICTPHRGNGSKSPSCRRTCVCDPGWFGEDCGRLDLSPAKRDGGYNYTDATSPSYYGAYGNSSWGGQIVQDLKDSTLFHLIVDQFAHGCGLTGWRPHSTIIRAESRTGPQGPFHYAETIAGTFRHNAYVFFSPWDRKYLLYSIGANYTEQGKCQSFSYKQWPNNISVSSADDIRGPWSPFKLILSSTPPLNPHSTNPAPWPLWSKEDPNSKIVLGVEDNAIFMGDTWDGNYTLVKVQDWNITEYSPTWTEDTFLWRDKRGNWHALDHWLIDLVEHPGQQWPRVGAHIFARNLTGPWHFPLHEAYNSSVTFTDGSLQVFKRRERPKLYFSDDGELTPLYLTTGVQAMNQTGPSHTLIQPIGTKWKAYEAQFPIPAASLPQR